MLPNRPLLAVLTALVASCPMPGQSETARWDSGYLDHEGVGFVSVYRATLLAEGATAVQLKFGECHLPAGSEIRITGCEAGAVQRFDAESLRAYQGYSAIFNGDSLRVELRAASRSRSNRIVIAEIRRLASGGVERACDDEERLLSFDPRVGRLDGCCTCWLTNEFTAVTAGHCIAATDGHLVHFNVPLSSSTGIVRYPLPEDQYALEAQSLTRSEAGIGRDWGVFACVRNSNTGLFPGQAQGAWFTVSDALPTVGSMLRATGFGSTAQGTPGSWNRAQKTSVGPRIPSGFSHSVAAQAHLTGCNSGSPIIDDAGGDVVAVATHVICADGVRAFGTTLSSPEFAAALSGVQASRTAGTVEAFGRGCGGASGPPRLAVRGIPEVGRSLRAEIEGAGSRYETGTFGSLVVGFSRTLWSGGELPARLGRYGMASCSLLVSPDLGIPVAISGGRGGTGWTIPADPSWVGIDAYCQFFGFDSSVPWTAPLSSSNGTRVLVGN